ncbi:MAG: aminotransferase class V-fold PLP-dependent enzyme [Bifidobacteriaceae bacterium]|jgi:cysteine desulfurase|nr:aminotransferase class V-fold PLP-dependent enzyme [Bifidobacteriaceae bacterium]
MNPDIYLDYAAGAPMRPAALAAYADACVTANPHATHRPARRARQALDQARESIALALGASPAEVIFTSGGTEADGLAIGGIYAARQEGAARPYLLVGATEHAAVADNAQAAGGARVLEIPVDCMGLADLDFVAEHLRRHGQETALISLMAANNETGALQPVTELAAMAMRFGVPVHSDWVQAVGKLPLSLGGSGLAAASCSAHKLGGPVGVGVLLAGRRTPLKAVVGGGGQERGVRSGTLDARGAAGFAAALEQALGEDPATLERFLAPLDALIEAHPSLTALTPSGAHLPGLRSFAVADAEGEAMVYLLDQAGLACSAGSACTAGVAQPSRVLLAMGLGQWARSAVRVSLGWESTAADVKALVAALPEAIDRAQVAARRRAAPRTRATGRVPEGRG